MLVKCYAPVFLAFFMYYPFSTHSQSISTEKADLTENQILVLIDLAKKEFKGQLGNKESNNSTECNFYYSNFPVGIDGSSRFMICKMDKGIPTLLL
ncbi:MAG: hypothetical protein QM734_09880 [Cyclobacteriaceae bacterium]